MNMRPPLNFKPISGQDSKGFCALQIYRPGEWMDADRFSVFVGGCGVGHVSDLPRAKALLMERAVDYCERQIQNAIKVIAHYSLQKATLETTGLVPEPYEKTLADHHHR